jgi:hypothetical protein
VVQLLDREFQAALVSICACAFSIDALYGALIEKMPVSPAVQRTWVNKGTPHYGRIAQTLHTRFKLGPLTNTLRKNLNWLFGLRDDAVHFGEEDRDVVPHPVGVHVAAAQLDFSSDRSHRAIRLLASVFRAVANGPRPGHAPLEAWVETHRAGLVALADRLDRACE